MMPERKHKALGGGRNLPEQCMFLRLKSKLFKALLVTERLGTVLPGTGKTLYLHIHLIV